jgi:hypothetical protein
MVDSSRKKQDEAGRLAADTAGTCFTIGHSAHSFDQFADLLKSNEIGTIADVRSTPYSKHVPQFNQDTLQLALRNLGIGYMYMGDTLGARYSDPRLIGAAGRVDFVKVAQRQEFRMALQLVINAISKGHRVALMCSEGNPFDCHRFVLVSRALQASGIEVFHIMPNGTLISNPTLEDRLVKKYFPQVEDEPGLFPAVKTPWAELVAMGYAERAADIAYKVGGNEEEET